MDYTLDIKHQQKDYLMKTEWLTVKNHNRMNDSISYDRHILLLIHIYINAYMFVYQ